MPVPRPAARPTAALQDTPATSSDLQWLLVRKQNAFVVKKLAEGPILSKEPGNLLGVHSQKFSGLVNAKTIDISAAPAGVAISTRKLSASKHAVAKSQHKSIVRPRSGPRRVARIVARYAGQGYRPDLRKYALARASAVLASQKEAAPARERKVRGRKAVKA